MKSIKTILVCVVGGLILSCDNQNNLVKHHNRLLEFDNLFRAESFTPEADKYLKKHSLEDVEVSYIEDYIIVSTWNEVNACGNCVGDINFSNDTLELFYQDISEEQCTSLTIHKFTYFISNYGNEKYIVVNKGYQRRVRN